MPFLVLEASMRSINDIVSEEENIIKGLVYKLNEPKINFKDSFRMFMLLDSQDQNEYLQIT